MRNGHHGMAETRAPHEAKSRRVFGQARKQVKMFRAGLRVSIPAIVSSFETHVV